MSVGIFNSACRILLSSDFFIARRPVLDRHLHPVAQELVFWSLDEEAGSGAAEPAAGALVIEDVCRHGLPRVLGDLGGILRVSEAVLMDNAVMQLPADLVVLELPARQPPGAALLARCERLAAAGYRFALAAGGAETALEALLPLAAFVRVNVDGKDEQAVRSELVRYRAPGRQVCAAHVDTREQYRQCLALGFDCFQGYFFAVPEAQPGKKFGPSQQVIGGLLALLASDADDAQIEHGIKADVRLGLNLLRLANSPAFTAHRVDSLRQALMALGRDHLQRWLHMLLYAEADGGGAAAHALGSLAVTRGRLMELAAQKLVPGNRGVADTAFTVGIMSLMDTLFGTTMEDILRQVPVVDEVRDALLDRRGFQGRLLSLAIEAESLRQPGRLLAVARDLRLSCNDLYQLQLDAFEWSDDAGRSLHEPN